MSAAETTTFGKAPERRDVKVPLRPARLVVAWVMSALSLVVAAWIVPHVAVVSFWGALARRRGDRDPERARAAGAGRDQAAVHDRLDASCSCCSPTR